MDRAPFEIGEAVVDRELDDPNTAIIVNCPPQPADEWIAYRDTTVAEDNLDYPEDSPVAVAVYRDELAEFDPNWADRSSDDPYPLSEFNDNSVSHYAFPAPRLRSLDQGDTNDGNESERTGPDEGTSDASTADRDIDPDEECDGKDGGEASPGEESDSEPSPAVHDLKETLADRGLTAEIDADGQTVVVEKLGITYRVQPGGVLDGDGPHRDTLDQIVTDG